MFDIIRSPGGKVIFEVPGAELTEKVGYQFGVGGACIPVVQQIETGVPFRFRSVRRFPDAVQDLFLLIVEVDEIDALSVDDRDALRLVNPGRLLIEGASDLLGAGEGQPGGTSGVVVDGDEVVLFLLVVKN